ncbi:TIGR03643 family protein [Psychroflexus salis]|nr:TIGR03643 family protein [Psychroflexus salis]
MDNYKEKFTEREIDRIIEMAWEDRTPFGAIEFQFGVKEADVIKIMRLEMKASSFRMWRKRVQGRKTKHRKLRNDDVNGFRCSRQRHITGNKISKR